MRAFTPLLLAAVLLSGCAGGGVNPGDDLKRQSIGGKSADKPASKPAGGQGSSPSGRWSGCGNYETRAQAQSAWERAGKPSSADRNGDGVVCTRLPASSAAQSSNCKRQDSPRVVLLNRGRYPQTSFHVEEAIRMGAPEVLTIERTGTAKKRDDWAKVVGDIPNLRERNLDQDEYPPAMSADKEGAGREANIALVDSADNRGAGSSMGSQLRGWCDGQKFKIKIYGRAPGPVKITIVANGGRRMNKTVSSN